MSANKLVVGDPVAGYPPTRQSGAVLLTALVMLLILTVLGMSSMGNNIMEERMAANSQETHRAFQAAEAAVEQALAGSGVAFSTENTRDNKSVETFTGADLARYGSHVESLSHTVYFRHQGTPPRGSGWDSSYALYHFDVEGRATTKGQARASIHAGRFQIAPR